MTDSFDLTSRPWLPCERLDGGVVELSTRDALADAHRLRGLADPSPLVMAALHRHLLAVLHRVVAGPRTMKEWATMAGAGSFEVGLVDAYLGSVRERMDLFHPTHPFAQTAGLIEQFPSDPIDMLTLERSSWGVARALFQHRAPDYRAAMTPGAAARALLAHHAFATGGLVKKPNEPTAATAAPLVRAAVVVLRGDTLFKTLVANLLRYDPTQALPIAGDPSDLPSWEQAPLPRQLRMAQEPRRLPRGWLDLLTWTSRRIQLVREGAEVTGYVRAVGQGLSEDAPQDPMVAYRRDEKRGFVSLGLNPDRAFWRNANAFFEAGREGAGFARPKAIDQAIRREAEQVLGTGATYSLELYGLSAFQSKVDVVRAERVSAAVRFFDDDDARDVVKRALERAEKAVEALKTALRSYARHMLSQGSRAPEGKDIGAFVTYLGAEPAVWSALGVAFDVFLRGLGGGVEIALASFVEETLLVVNQAFARAVASADGTARSLKARALAERSLREGLAPLFASKPIPVPEVVHA
jgi:CRISPR system Cascade subunit CasA